MKSTKIKMIDKNMRFYETSVKNLREDFVFSLVKSGQMNMQQFSAWVEGVRDEWFQNGLNQSAGSITSHNPDLPQAVNSDIEFF
jgi:hypothetical protein